jgi:hypothetical protein
MFIVFKKTDTKIFFEELSSEAGYPLLNFIQDLGVMEQ